MLELLIAFFVVNDADGEGAAGALGNFLSVSDLFEGDLELVAAGAGVEEGGSFGIKVQIFDFDFVVDFG